MKDPQSALFRDVVTEEQVASFCAVTGFSPALRARFGVPPTFVTRYRHGEFALFEQLKISLSQLLHVDQVYDYRFPIRVGDEIQYVTRLTHVLDKTSSGRRTQFLTLITEFVAWRGGEGVGIAAVAKTVVVVRGAPPEAA